MFEFNIPPTIVMGAGASAELVPQLRRLKANRVLLVTDAFMAASGVAGRFVDTMTAANIVVELFTGVQSDPTDANVRAGAAAYHAASCEAVVALGGGSPIDAAKVIAVLVTNGEPLSAMEGAHRVAKAGAPLIIIPTTAGTGSEMTRVAIITDTDRDVKMLLLDRHLVATTALIDHELTHSMPPALTAHVGVDTLTHGIEAYVSRRANALSDPLALQCIALCGSYLEVAYREPGNAAAREAMMTAATLGGMAFSNASVALVHGMSRPIGALFHVPHGLSNAVLLPTVTRYSLAGAPERYAQVARAMAVASDDDPVDVAGAKLVDALEALNRRLDIPQLRDCKGLDARTFADVVGRMADDAIASGSPAHNPVVPDRAAIIHLYEAAY